MSKDLNQCNFIGRLGKPPEVKYLPTGNAVVNFSIACSDDYKDKTTGQKVEQTNWINIVAFGKLAEIVGEYCDKGKQIYVSGKQVTRKWQDNSGADKYTTEIVATDVQLLGSKGDGANQGGQQAPQQRQPQQRRQPQQNQGAQGGGYADFDDDVGF